MEELILPVDFNDYNDYTENEINTFIITIYENRGNKKYPTNNFPSAFANKHYKNKKVTQVRNYVINENQC